MCSVFTTVQLVARATTVPSARSDARRNRELLVATARELFASDGLGVPAREIARRAGVGVGTLYRHFPVRPDLVDAVLAEEFEEVIRIAESALAAPDAWHGFTSFVEDTLALHARNRGLKEAVEMQARGRRRVDAMRRRIRPLIARLVERAQAEGTLRSDFAPQDVALLFWASDRVIELAASVAPEIWKRHLTFVLDGLRSGATTPLAQAPLTDAQLSRAGRA